MVNDDFQGTVELQIDGVNYQASYEAHSCTIHLDIAGHRKMTAVTLPGATGEESALRILRLFIIAETSRSTPRS